MGRNCLEEYLTDGCASCDDWSDGTGEKTAVGCCCSFPIGMCPHFAKMMKEDERNQKDEKI